MAPGLRSFARLATVAMIDTAERPAREGRFAEAAAAYRQRLAQGPSCLAMRGLARLIAGHGNGSLSGSRRPSATSRAISTASTTSTFRAHDYDIGTGAAEGAIKNLIGARLDGGGMRWGRQRSERVLLLRCVLLSGQWDELARYVAKKRTFTLAAKPTAAETYDAEPNVQVA